MRKFLTISLLLTCLLPAACTKPSKKSSAPVSTSGDAIRAVSLQGLQAQLRNCMPQNSCPQELLQFAGIKKIMGVIADEQNHDLIVFGPTDDDRPPLQLEDFVGALRNAWLQYAPLNDNVYQYSSPGCSIDPNPRVMQQLQQVGHSLHTATTSAKITKSLDNWNRVCELPQSVRVLGIPFDTHFAQVLVKADYDMKQLVDGSDPVDIPGLTSMKDMRVEAAENQLAQGQPITLSGPTLNRFWFYPGENVYEEHDGIILIKECPVTLLTEEMYSNRGGQLAGSGGANPLANTYADSLTLLYDKLAEERPIFDELENLFRFVALAQILKARYASPANFDLSYLLEGYPVPLTPVAKSLPGRHAIKQIQHREESAGGSSELTLYLPSCGGVDIRLDENSTRFLRSSNAKLPDFKQGVLTGRGTRDTPYWAFPKATEVFLDELSYNSRILKLNRANKESRLFTVVVGTEGRTTRYALYDGESKQQFSNIPDLVARVNERVAGEPRRVVYLDLQGLPTEDKLEGFATSCRLEQAKRNQDIEIVTLGRKNNSSEISDAILGRGIRFDHTRSTVEEVTQGTHKGWFRASMRFLVHNQRSVKGILAHAYLRTKELALRFIETVRLKSSDPIFRTSSLSDVINQTRRELGDEVFLIYENELGDTYVGKLVRAQSEDFGQ
ncbi:MAG: DUF1598 domain-containing protein [Acidobacteriota bacterium]